MPSRQYVLITSSGRKSLSIDVESSIVSTMFGLDEFLTFSGSSDSAVNAAYVGVTTGPSPTRSASDAARMRLVRDGLRSVLIVFPTRICSSADHCLHKRQRVVGSVHADGDAIEGKWLFVGNYMPDEG